MAGAQRASKKKTEEQEAEVVEEITQPELSLSSQLGKGPQSEEVQEQEDLEQKDLEQEDQELEVQKQEDQEQEDQDL